MRITKPLSFLFAWSLAFLPVVTDGAVDFSDNFESYAAQSAIDGQGAWINTASTLKWTANINANAFTDVQGNLWPGQFLIGNNLNTDPLDGFAILRVSNPGGFAGLAMSLDAALQANVHGKIQISPDDNTWTDVTSAFSNLQPRADNKFYSVSADLSAQAASAGIGDDLYVRFSSYRDSSSVVSFNLFAIDNLQISAVPEPSTFIAGFLLILPSGLIGIQHWRNRKQES
jgi:hypothetical protein